MKWPWSAGAATFLLRCRFPAGLKGFQKGVEPFFKTYCIKCHVPEKSKGGITVHSLNRAWLPSGFHNGTGSDEISVFGGQGRGNPCEGIQIASPPITGEFRIRLSASALLLPGHDEAPLRLIMGMPIDGDHNEKAHQVVGTAYLTNSPDEPKVPCSTKRT